MIPDSFLYFAHQGGGLLAPENTLAAFELGATYQPDALELDIQTTRDGQIVVLHDPTVDRTTDGRGPVAGYTLDELRRLDAGYRFTPDGGATYPFRGQGVTIPTLREVFERFPDKLINIDLKEPAQGKEGQLWQTIQDAGAVDRVIVGSFVCASLRRFRRLAGGEIATRACPREVAEFVLRCRLRATRLVSSQTTIGESITEISSSIASERNPEGVLNVPAEGPPLCAASSTRWRPAGYIARRRGWYTRRTPRR